MSLFLKMVWENILISSFYMLLSSFPSTTYWRGHIFSIVYSCLLCHRLIVHWCGLISRLTILFQWSMCLFYASTMLLRLLQLCSIIWSQVAVLFSFALLFKIALAIWVFVCFQTNFKIICSFSVKNVIGILIGIALNL